MNHPAAVSVEQEQPARFSVEEFMGMVEAGAFATIAGKIELVEGVIVRMSPAQNPHVMYQRQVFLKLHALFGDGRDGFIVVQEPTVRTGKGTVRDPDVAILRKPERIAKEIFAARDVRLAVEVSDTTIADDRGAKRLSYARAGIAHYWVVDINRRQVHVSSSPAAGVYASESTVVFGEPLPVPGTDGTILVEELR